MRETRVATPTYAGVRAFRADDVGASSRSSRIASSSDVVRDRVVSSTLRDESSRVCNRRRCRRRRQRPSVVVRPCVPPRTLPRSRKSDRRQSKRAPSSGRVVSVMAGSAADQASACVVAHGHAFQKKTFHKPTYCHHCGDMLWGLIQQGFVCEVCNFVVHERCSRTVISPCSSIAASLVKNPVGHCWSETLHHKRKFCNVCRKRLDDCESTHCEICQYYVHVECQDFAIPDCKETATYTPGRIMKVDVEYGHHWREGNLPAGAKCEYCKKACAHTECLSGFQCEWCWITCHSLCFNFMEERCNFGVLQPIYLPPHAVSIPRTEMPLEAIIGVQVRKKETLSPRSTSEDFSSGDAGRYKETDDMYSSKDKQRKEEDDEVIIKVFDGNTSLRRRIFRVIVVNRLASLNELLLRSLRAFHISKDVDQFYLTDIYSQDEDVLQDPTPVLNLHRREGKRPAVFLRFKGKENESGEARVYPGKLEVSETFCYITVNSQTTVADLIKESLVRFDLDCKFDELRCLEVLLDRGVTDRVLSFNERPWEIMKNLAKDSIRQMELMRFYLQPKKDPHGPNVALFVGNFPPNLSERQYETLLNDILGRDMKYLRLEIIYYEYGSMIVIFQDSETAVRALYLMRDIRYEDKQPLIVMLLPNIEESMITPGANPLLVFVNIKSGGCQGLELISSFRRLLNPYQVFDLDMGGPLPGLYVFRNIVKYKILVCGGDGTIGWVLQCLDNVGQDSKCDSPACAIVPLGTGNDLARVLRWGPGYSGGEDPLSLLKDVIEAEEILLDRWTVVFHPEDAQGKPEENARQVNSTGKKRQKLSRMKVTNEQIKKTAVAGGTSEDNSQIFVMNNYFGIGLDADLCLNFHNAREENPGKFVSRFHNKGVYVKMGLRRMVGQGKFSVKDLHKRVKLEVDFKPVNLPNVEGIIVLNILSWGSGANPWGPQIDEGPFRKPTHCDGMLEVVGVTGVVHLGQIQSGLRNAVRIAQGKHIRINIGTDIPVQVDGEPWIQSACEVVILKSALKATMLRKKKFKRRGTEPYLDAAEEAANQPGASGVQIPGPRGLNQPSPANQAAPGQDQSATNQIQS